MADLPHIYRGMGERAALRALPALVDKVRTGRRTDIVLAGCGLTAVPEALRGLTLLRRLDLGDNRLTAVPAWLGELTGLERLTLRANRLGVLPDSVGALARLQMLDIGHNRLVTLPDATSRLSSLERLSLEDNRVTTVPWAVTSMTGLISLHLGTNRLVELPDDLRGLARLEELYLQGNRIDALPGSVADLTTLWMLDLTGNRLTTLPDALDSLTQLRALRLSDNQLALVPPVVCRLVGLESLHLACNELSAIPDTLGALPKLVRLDVTNNHLTTLPKPLTRLRALETGGNPMSPWPPPPPQTLNLERRSAPYNEVISALMGWGWRGGKDGIDDMEYALRRLPHLTGNERTDAEDLAISLVREGGTYFAHVLGLARCTRAVPLLRETATDPSVAPLRRLQAAQGLILMDPAAGRAVAIDILHDTTTDQTSRQDAMRLLAEHPSADARRALEQALEDPDRHIRSEAEWRLHTIRQSPKGLGEVTR
jgi:Leucine-rich repeat (LRR) protein